MASPKKHKSTSKNVVEEIQLDALIVDEPKKPAPRTPLYKEEDGDEGNWHDIPKKNNPGYDGEEDELENDDKDVEETEEDEVFFREKGPKSQ
jgi:hypothetical protein